MSVAFTDNLALESVIQGSLGSTDLSGYPPNVDVYFLYAYESGTPGGHSWLFESLGTVASLGIPDGESPTLVASALERSDDLISGTLVPVCETNSYGHRCVLIATPSGEMLDSDTFLLIPTPDVAAIWNTILLPPPPERTPIMSDDTAESPQAWVDVPLGPGQMPGLQGNGDFQWTEDGDPTFGTDVRRTPGRDHAVVIHRPPENPA